MPKRRTIPNTAVSHGPRSGLRQNSGRDGPRGGPTAHAETRADRGRAGSVGCRAGLSSFGEDRGVSSFLPCLSPLASMGHLRRFRFPGLTGPPPAHENMPHRRYRRSRDTPTGALMAASDRAGYGRRASWPPRHTSATPDVPLGTARP